MADHAEAAPEVKEEAVKVEKKKDVTTAILEKKKSPNRLIVGA